MNKNNNETQVVIKPVYQRHVAIDENIHSTLTIHSLSLYMAFRYQADFSKEDAEVKRSAQFLYTRAKISRPQYYRCLIELEKHGLVLRDPENKLGDKCVFHVARELGYFTRGVSDRDRGVSDRDTDHNPSSGSNINITTEESDDSAVAIPKKPNKPNIDLRVLIDIYGKWFPDNPQPYRKAISTTLEKVLKTLIKRWPEAHPNGLPFTYEQFESYMDMLSTNAPKFSKGEYTTDNGRKKKNTMVTFCRWDTFIQFLEGKYS